MLSKKGYNIYKEVNFLERFEELGKKYDYSVDDSMYKPDVRLVQEMLETLGYKVRYFKSEHFYRITQKVGGLFFMAHIDVRSGFLDMMIYIYIGENEKTGKYLDYGGVVQRVAKFIKRHQYEIEEAEVKVRPSFQTYEELEEILKEAFLIYEDLKAEVIRVENLEKNLL